MAEDEDDEPPDAKELAIQASDMAVRTLIAIMSGQSSGTVSDQLKAALGILEVAGLIEPGAFSE
jgi:hypothetical protein